MAVYKVKISISRIQVQNLLIPNRNDEIYKTNHKLNYLMAVAQTTEHNNTHNITQRGITSHYKNAQKTTRRI